MFNKKYNPATSYRPSFFAFFCIAGMLVMASMLLSSCGGEATAASATNALQSTSAQNSVSIPIKVYFSKDTQTNFNNVSPVNRISPTTGVATYAIQLLIAGPTTEERAAGYYSPLNSMFSAPSTCGTSNLPGPDFQLTLNKKGTVTEQGTATVKFCRQTSSPGIGTDASVSAEINATLKQFPTIKKVVILLQNGHCFGDESGLDHCLQ